MDATLKKKIGKEARRNGYKFDDLIFWYSLIFWYKGTANRQINDAVTFWYSLIFWYKGTQGSSSC